MQPNQQAISDEERANLKRTTRRFLACSTGRLSAHYLPNMEFAHLSTRTQNALKDEGIKTEAELRMAWEMKGPEWLLRIPNFGRKSLNEVKAAYSLQTPPPTPKPISQEDYERAKRIVRLYEESVGKPL